MAWLLLAGAALLEVVWATALQHSDGFTRLWPSVLSVAVAGLSFAMLSFALRGLPMGTAYAVWVGLGALGVASVGILMLGESTAPLRLVFLGLVLAGVAGLKAMGG